MNASRPAARRQLNSRRIGFAAVLLSLAMLLTACLSAEDRAEKPPTSLPPAEAWEKARVEGRYRMLLRQFKSEGDWMEYGAFHDLGLRHRPNFAGQTDLPAGYWVYVYPHWYIWRDRAGLPQPQRGWGPEQVTGPPNTLMAGDITTAWASRSQDDQKEWLLVEYDRPVVPVAVTVHETYNPGAVYKVTLFKLSGEEVEAWKGKDPIKPEDGKGVAVIPVKADFPVTRVKVHIDSPAVAGWNEIDAIGLRDAKGNTHWAVACEASTTYAQQQPTVLPPQVMQQRLLQLEGEVNDLKDTVRKLRAELKKRDDQAKRIELLEAELKLLRKELQELRASTSRG